MKKNALIYVVLFFTGLIVVTMSLYIGNNLYKQAKMKENPSYAKGVITGVAFSAKMGPSINYQFTVEKRLNKSSCPKQGGDYFAIGDSCLVIYDKNNVSINNLYRDKLGRLYLLNKKDSIKDEWNKYIDSLLQMKKAGDALNNR